MIKEFEYYHGAVFTKLIHEAKENIFISLRNTATNASYVINNKVGLYIKHSTKRMSPWRFSFQKIHQEELLLLKQNLDEVFLILVCGEDGFVTLSFEDIKIILNDNHETVEWISAARNPRKEYTVNGSDGSLGRKISKNDFPRKVIESLF